MGRANVHMSTQPLRIGLLSVDPFSTSIGQSGVWIEVKYILCYHLDSSGKLMIDSFALCPVQEITQVQREIIFGPRLNLGALSLLSYPHILVI